MFGCPMKNIKKKYIYIIKTNQKPIYFKII